MPDNPAGPEQGAGTTDAKPAGENLQEQLDAATADASKWQKSYQERRSLGDRQGQELSRLRQENEQYRRSFNQVVDGGDDPPADVHTQRREALDAQSSAEARQRRINEKEDLGILKYKVEHEDWRESLEPAKEYAREHGDSIVSFDRDGDADVFASLSNSRTQLRLAQLEAAEAKRSAVTKETDAHRAELKSHAQVTGATASEGAETINLDDLDSNDMLDKNLVPGFEKVPRLQK